MMPREINLVDAVIRGVKKRRDGPIELKMSHNALPCTMRWKSSTFAEENYIRAVFGNA